MTSSTMRSSRRWHSSSSSSFRTRPRQKPWPRQRPPTAASCTSSCVLLLEVCQCENLIDRRLPVGLGSRSRPVLNQEETRGTRAASGLAICAEGQIPGAMFRFLAGAWATATLVVVALPAVPAAANPPTTFNPVVEAQNFSITQQRQAVYDTPSYQAALAADSAASTAQALAAEAADPGRFFTDDLCWNLSNGCAGDIRLNDWAANGDGIVRPVLFTARNGATLSGHVWATVAGPARRPGIVITNGSVQADEELYWYAAQALAKAGYVVLTFDPQGQGQSDTFGQSPDQTEGVPAQTTGTPFYDGTEDALNFFLSTPSSPYVPVPSCQSGTSHEA